MLSAVKFVELCTQVSFDTRVFDAHSRVYIEKLAILRTSIAPVRVTKAFAVLILLAVCGTDSEWWLCAIEKIASIIWYIITVVNWFIFIYFFLCSNCFLRCLFQFLPSKFSSWIFVAVVLLLLQVQKNSRAIQQGLGRIQISTMCVKNNLLVAGGFQGELVAKVCPSKCAFRMLPCFLSNSIMFGLIYHLIFHGCSRLVSYAFILLTLCTFFWIVTPWEVL